MQKEKQREFTLSESTAVMEQNSDRFFGQKQLRAVAISDSVTEIELSAFCHCTGLTEVMIPSSVIVIGGYAFKNCTDLLHITIPNSVKLIEWYAFSGCKKLTYIIYRGTVKEWRSIPKGMGWDSNTGHYTVICADGTIQKR